MPEASPHLLLCGFEPFGGLAHNPSLDVVSEVVGRAEVGQLVTQQEHDDVVISSRALPVEFGRAGELLTAAVEQHPPAVVICVRLAAGRPAAHYCCRDPGEPLAVRWHLRLKRGPVHPPAPHQRPWSAGLSRLHPRSRPAQQRFTPFPGPSRRRCGSGDHRIAEGQRRSAEQHRNPPLKSPRFYNGRHE